MTSLGIELHDDVTALDEYCRVAESHASVCSTLTMLNGLDNSSGMAVGLPPPCRLGHRHFFGACIHAHHVLAVRGPLSYSYM